MSRVFLFNPNHYSVQYMVNGGRTPLVQPTGNDYTPNFISVSGLSTEAGSLYTPAQLVVPRVKHEDKLAGAGFLDGENTVIIEWVSSRITFTVEIPGVSSVSLLDDLILYIARTKVILLNARGNILKMFEI